MGVKNPKVINYGIDNAVSLPLRISKGFLKNALKNAISFILKQENVCKTVYSHVSKQIAVSFKKYKQLAKCFSGEAFQWSLIFTLTCKVLHCTHNYKYLHSNFYTTLYILTQNYLKRNLSTIQLVRSVRYRSEEMLLNFCECKITTEFWSNAVQHRIIKTSER